MKVKLENNISEYVYTGSGRPPKYITQAVIQEGVTTIEEFAFAGCTQLVSVEIPNSVKTIEAYAFDGCAALKSVNIPNSVEKIGNSAFNECSSLTKVNVPDGITRIGVATFAGCKSLKSIDLPNSVKIIERYAFDECHNLETVNMANDVEVDEPAFDGCNKLNNKDQSVVSESGGSKYMKHYTDGKGHYISVYRDSSDGKLYGEGDVPARGYTVEWTNDMAEHCEIDLGFQEITNLNPANINLDEYEYCSHANGRDAHWHLYRKIVDGKGKWVARHQNTGEIREITYDQARGFEPIDDSAIRRLSRDLGSTLLPKREGWQEDWVEPTLDPTPVDNVNGLNIYKGTDQYGEEAYYLIDEDDDDPDPNYHEWQTETLELAREWASSYENPHEDDDEDWYIQFSDEDEDEYEDDDELILVEELGNEVISETVSLVEPFNSMVTELKKKYSYQFDFVTAVSESGKMAVFDIYNKGTIDCLRTVFFDIDSYQGLSDKELEAAMMKTAEDKIQLCFDEFFGGQTKTEAKNYGGAYDIEPDQYFTRDDLNDFSNEVADSMADKHGIITNVTGCYITDNKLELEVSCGDYDYSYEEVVDMRKIKKPSDLTSKYAPVFIDKIYQQVKADQDQELKESSQKAFTYKVKKHFRESMDVLTSFDSIEAAIAFCLEEPLSVDNGHALSIWNDKGSIFEISYTGNCELNIDKCATEEELEELKRCCDEYNLKVSSLLQERVEKDFKFKCKKCGNEFIDKYDYPLPTDCNAAVYCPKCKGVSHINEDKTPIDPNSAKLVKSEGELNWSNTAPNRRRADFECENYLIEIEEHNSPVDGLHCYVYVDSLDTDEVLVNGREFGSASSALEWVSEWLYQQGVLIESTKQRWQFNVKSGKDPAEFFTYNDKAEAEKKREEAAKEAGEDEEVSKVYAIK